MSHLCVLEVSDFSGSSQRPKRNVSTKPIPLLFKEGWLRLNKKIPFLSGADGVVGNFKENKERYASI